MDPRTPIKKFAALLFKLANVRQQIFKQLRREFVEVSTIGSGSGSGGKVSNILAVSDFGSFVSKQNLTMLQSEQNRMSFGLNDSIISNLSQ